MIFSKKGSVLVFSLVLLGFMLVSALSISAVSVAERRSANATARSMLSFQVADSGVEKLLQNIYQGDFATLSALASGIGGSCSSGVISVSLPGNSSYRVFFYPDASNVPLTDCSDTAWREKVVRLKSEGMFGNTTRAVDVAVEAPEDVVGFWKFDEGMGLVVADSSSKNNDGSITGANPSWTTRPRSAPNPASNALHFSGANGSGSLRLANTTNDAYNFSGDITGTAWIRTSTDGRGILFYQKSYALIYVQVGATTAGGTANKLVVYLRTGGNTGAPDVCSGTTTVTDGNWHFVAFTRDAHRQKIGIYIDGSATPEVECNFNAANIGAIDTDTNLNHMIGDLNNAALTYEFSGDIDDVRIYDKALSGADIQKIYDATR